MTNYNEPMIYQDKRINKGAMKCVLFISLLIFSILYFSSLDSHPVIQGGKNGYILLAMSIVQGKGYSDICLVVPKEDNIGWPPVTSSILAPLVYLFGLNFFFLKIPGLILGLFSLLLIYIYMKKIAGDYFAFVLMILTGFSPLLIYYSHTPWSDVPYLFFSILTLIFIEKYYIEERWLSWSGLLSLTFLLLSYFTRQVGLTLFAAFVTYFLFEKSKSKDKLPYQKVIFLSLPYILFLSLWWIRNIRILRNPNIMFTQEFLNDPFSSFQKPAKAFIDILMYIIKDVYALIFYILPKIFTGLTIASRNFIWIILSLIILLGFFSKILKKRQIIDYYCIFYLLLLLIWPVTARQGDRYFFPLIPFIFYYFFLGIKKIQEILKLESKKQKFIISAVLITAILALNVFGICTFLEKRREDIKSEKYFLEMAGWVKNNTPPDSIFVSMDPASVYLFTTRKTLPGLILPSGKLTESFFKLKKAYVIESDVFGDRRYLTQSINDNLNRFEMLYEENKNIVYRLIN